MSKAKASTLKTRERTVDPPSKKKPNGDARVLRTASFEESESEMEDNVDEVVDLGGLGENEEPLAASDAEPDPEELFVVDTPVEIEAAPTERRGRGRPKGTGTRRTKTSVATAAPSTGSSEPRDLFSALCEAGYAIKRLASDFERTPEQVLQAIGQIVGAASGLEAPSVTGEEG